MRGYTRKEIFVRGKTRRLVIEDDPRSIGYFSLDEDEFKELQERLLPITFRVSPDIPVGYSKEVSILGSLAVDLAEAMKLLYQDRELRKRALPPYLHDLAGDEDALMAGVGFDFFVGRHLPKPTFIEAAAFGPEFASTAIMAEFFGMRTADERFAAWWNNLVKPVIRSGWWEGLVKPLLGGSSSLHFVTAIADLDFTRDKEHEVLALYLKEQGVDVTCGPAEDSRVLQAEAVYIRIGLIFPQVWERIRETKLWHRIREGKVKVIPPTGNNFFSSKYILPILANSEELTARGFDQNKARLIAVCLPNVFYLDVNLLNFLRTIVSSRHPIWLKGVWNYGGYGTRRISDPRMLNKALGEITKYNLKMPIIVEEEVQPGFVPADWSKSKPERRIEVRVRVFDHEGTIKTQPPSARVYLPGDSYPMDSLYLGPEILPVP